MKKYFLVVSVVLAFYRPAFAELRCLKSNPAGNGVGLEAKHKDNYIISVYENGRIDDYAIYKKSGIFDLEKIFDGSNGKEMPDHLRLVSSPLIDIRGYVFRLSGLPQGIIEFYLTDDCFNRNNKER